MKICDENIFSDSADWSSKDLWKMISADVNEVPSEFKIQCEKGVYLSFYFGWYSIHLHIVC